MFNMRSANNWECINLEKKGFARKIRSMDEEVRYESILIKTYLHISCSMCNTAYACLMTNIRH